MISSQPGSSWSCSAGAAAAWSARCCAFSAARASPAALALARCQSPADFSAACSAHARSSSALVLRFCDLRTASSMSLAYSRASFSACAAFSASVTAAFGLGASLFPRPLPPASALAAGRSYVVSPVVEL